MITYPVRLRRNVILGITLLAALALPMSATAVSTSTPASYPLDACIVSGEALGENGDDVILREYEGRELRFCCKNCVQDFEQDQASYLKQLNEAIVQAQLADYPLGTCLVSGEALGGEMGDPVNRVVGNRLVRLCCASCEDDLNADPAKYLATLDAAVVTAQLEAYPADTCPISGNQLGAMGEPYNYVHAGQLVRFCCAGCIDKFNEDPQVALAGIYGAPTAAPSTQKNAAASNHTAHDHSAHSH